MDYRINNSDENYRDAVNFDGTNYYNFPMTIDVKGNKFVLKTGTSDKLWVKVRKNLLYIIAENSGLNYISLTVIDTMNNSFQDVYLDSNDIDQDYPKIFDYSTNYQIRLLSQRL
jgi:hypothetical protein